MNNWNIVEKKPKLTLVSSPWKNIVNLHLAQCQSHFFPMKGNLD